MNDVLVLGGGYAGVWGAAGAVRLALTTGSQLNRPSFPSSVRLFEIDTLDAAVALDTHLHRLPQRSETPGRYTVVVLEIVTELAGRMRDIAGLTTEVRVVLVESAEMPGPQLGDAPRPFIINALNRLKVEKRLGCTVISATADAVTLDDGEAIPTATVIWTVGMAASPLTAGILGQRNRFGRLPADEYLRCPTHLPCTPSATPRPWAGTALSKRTASRPKPLSRPSTPNGSTRPPTPLNCSWPKPVTSATAPELRSSTWHPPTAS